MHVLIVEDDPEMRGLLQEGLESVQYQASVAGSAEEGLALLESSRFDLVLLDVELPEQDGFFVLEKVRKREDPIPVIIMTGGRIDTDDRVKGLDLGADDYLIKPFDFPELLARIRAVLRRASGGEALKLKAADLEMDLPAQRVLRGGREIELTRREFALLEYLLRHVGQVVTREKIANDVWKETSRATPLDNVIDVHMSHLREKIDGDSDHKLIQTVWGKGFKLADTL